MVWPDLIITTISTDKDFLKTSGGSLNPDYGVDMLRVNLPSLKSFLMDKKVFS